MGPSKRGRLVCCAQIRPLLGRTIRYTGGGGGGGRLWVFFLSKLFFHFRDQTIIFFPCGSEQDISPLRAWHRHFFTPILNSQRQKQSRGTITFNVRPRGLSFAHQLCVMLVEFLFNDYCLFFNKIDILAWKAIEGRRHPWYLYWDFPSPLVVDGQTIFFHRFAELFIYFFMCDENKLFFALSAEQTFF